MTTTAAARLDGLLGSAARDMQRLSGGAAVCTFTRAGVPVPGIKYAEGRWAALRGVQRAAGPDGDVLATAREALDEWDGQLAALSTRGAGADWIGYRTGGIDALTDLIKPAA